MIINVQFNNFNKKKRFDDNRLNIIYDSRLNRFWINKID